MCEGILQPLRLLLIASTQPTCDASVATSTNRLRGFTFFKVQKSVGLSRTGLSLKIPVLQKLTVEAKDGKCGTEVGIKIAVLCWPSGDVAPGHFTSLCPRCVFRLLGS